MGDRLPTSSRPTGRGARGASNSPWHPSGTLAFDNWSYPTDARPESSTQHPPHPSMCKQPVPEGYSPQPAVGHGGQVTPPQRPGSTRMSPAERTPRALPSPQTLLAIRERPTPSNANQQLERNRRRNESPTTFLSRILSEPRPSPIDRRQTSMKGRHGDREIEHSDINARLASSRWERGGDFTSQLDRASKSALANMPARALTQLHSQTHVPSTDGQMSDKPHQGQLSDEYIHPARREIMRPAASGSECSTSDPVSEPEKIRTPKGPKSATSTNMLPVQARKILPVSRPRPQSTTYPIPTYFNPVPAPGTKPLYSSSNHIPTRPCGTKRAQELPEPPLSKRSKTLEDIRRVEAENKRILLENKSIEHRIQIARNERLRQEAIKKAAQELQLRALEVKNAKLRQDNIELKLQLERSTLSNDVREGSAGRGVVKALVEGPTAARLLPDVAKVEGQMKLPLGTTAVSDSPRPTQALAGAGPRLALEQMEVEIQSGDKNTATIKAETQSSEESNTAMIKARNSTRPGREEGEEIGPERPVKVEADEVAQSSPSLDFMGTEEVDIKMEDS